MAARRLIALLVVLLVISSIAAALAPTPAERDAESSTTTTTTTGPGEPDDAGSGAAPLIEATAEVPPPRGDAKGGRQTEPAEIEAAVGDQLALTVRTDETTAVEIPELGLLETASPGAPARFDLLLREPGRLAVLADGHRQVAWVTVAAPKAPNGNGHDDKRKEQASAD